MRLRMIVKFPGGKFHRPDCSNQHIFTFTELDQGVHDMSADAIFQSTANTEDMLVVDFHIFKADV